LLVIEGLSTKVIVITSAAGGSLEFILSWFYACTSLINPPLIISILSIRSIGQQIIDHKDYSKFKKIVNKILVDDELK